jgi:hypothetical protein
MVPVENCEGSNRFIPSERAILQINTEWLHAKSACDSGVRWFRKTFPNGCNYLELRSALAIGKHNSWESWILNAVGGDTATAGYRGTATAGDSGTATAGDRGTATAGYSGTATAGDSGTATAGDRGTATAGDSGTATAGYSGTATAGYRGTATAGDSGTATAGYSGTATAGYRGTATAGYRGTATAGEEGIIRILEWDEKHSRYRVITGIIGDSGIEANVPYIVVDSKLVRKEEA